VSLICDNQVVHIDSNSIFHKKSKHIERLSLHLRKDFKRDIATQFVNSNDQLTNVFTKLLRGLGIGNLCNKLETYDLYALT